jgi:hypothetical protein
MTPNADDELVRVAAADLVTIELYQRALKEAGIESRVVGDELTAGLGTALTGSVELWVWEEDAERAGAAIRYMEEHRGEAPRPEPQQHDRPTSDPRPHHGRPSGGEHPPRWGSPQG